MKQAQHHFLITERGYRADLFLESEPPVIHLDWTPHKPAKEHLAEIALEYLPWRDKVMAEWAKTIQTKILVATVDPNHEGASMVGFDETGKATYFDNKGIELPPLRG